MLIQQSCKETSNAYVRTALAKGFGAKFSCRRYGAGVTDGDGQTLCCCLATAGFKARARAVYPTGRIGSEGGNDRYAHPEKASKDICKTTDVRQSVWQVRRAAINIVQKVLLLSYSSQLSQPDLVQVVLNRLNQPRLHFSGVWV